MQTQFPPSRPASRCQSRRNALLALGVQLCLFLSAATASHADEATGRVSTARVPGGLKSIKAQAGVDGAIHVLADVDGSPQYVVSRDGGRTFGAPLAVADPASRRPGLKFTIMDLAVGRDSRVHAAFMTNGWQLKTTKTDWGFY